MNLNKRILVSQYELICFKFDGDTLLKLSAEEPAETLSPETF